MSPRSSVTARAGVPPRSDSDPTNSSAEPNWTSLAFLRYTEEMSAAHAFAANLQDFYRDFEALSFSCANCNSMVSGRRTEIDRFWLMAEIRCPSCKHAHNLWDVIAGEAEPGVT
jgi:hypothetical protein